MRYTKSELTQDTDPIVGGEDGDPLPYVPEWSFGLNADYEWTLKGNTRAYVGGSLGYTGDRTADFGNRTSDGGLRQADGYTTLNLRAGAYLGRWSVEVYGKNLTNERGVTVINERGRPAERRGRPRARPAPDRRRVGRDEVLGLVARCPAR